MIIAKHHLVRTITALCIIIAFTSTLYSKEHPHRSWDDLDDEAEKIFGSEKEQKYPIHAFIVEKEVWDGHYSCMVGGLYKFADYPRYLSLRMLPFYYRLESKIDNRARTVFPLFLSYHRVDGPTALTVTPLFYSDTSDIDANRSLAYLFWWGWERSPEGKRKSSYSALIPLYYYGTTGSDGPSSNEAVLITPLLYHRHGAKQEGERTTRWQCDISPLYYYNYASQDLPGREETTWWAPILPLTYHNVTPSRGHRNILWVIDYAWTADKGASSISRFWLVPLWFYKPGGSGYNVVLPPLYVENNSAGSIYRHLLPFFIHGREMSTRIDDRVGRSEDVHRDYLVTPVWATFHTYQKGKQGKEVPLVSTHWLPLIPLYYSSYDRAKGIHRNVVWLYDTHTTPGGETDRLWFIPIFFWKKGSYVHALPPLYMNWEETAAGHQTVTRLVGPVWYERGHATEGTPLPPAGWSRDKQIPGGPNRTFSTLVVFPLFYLNRTTVSRNAVVTDRRLTSCFLPLWFYRVGEQGRPAVPREGRESRERETLFITPLWYHGTASGAIKDGPIEGESRLWIPLVPLLYSSHTSAEGTSRNLLTLFDWKVGPDGGVTRFWFIPFLFREYREGGYLFVLPFYFRPRGSTEKEGYDFGTFFYRSRTVREEIKWTWLIHYYRSNPNAGDHVNVWFPFYMRWEYPDLKATSIAGPLYIDYDGTAHSWDLVLPLYFNYAAKNGSRKIHINIAGLSKSVTSGTKPYVSLGLGKHSDRPGWYIDTDWSWLYDVVSFSTRVTLGGGVKHGVGERKPGDPPDEMNNPHLGTERSDNEIRDGDRMPHSRLKEGEVALERRKSIDRADADNFVGLRLLFGLAAYQRADTRRHFRLLPLSWITWDEASKDEITWILNYISYRSGESEFFVFFPLYGKQREGLSYKYGYLLNLFWYEYAAPEDMKEYTFLWPFFNMYASPRKSGWRFAPLIWHKRFVKGSEIFTRTISPLYYASGRDNLADGRALESFSLSPLHYYHREDDGSRLKRSMFFPIIPLYYNSVEVKSSRPLTPGDPEHGTRPGKALARSEEHTSWLLPLFYYNSLIMAGDAAPVEQSTIISPLWYSSHSDAAGSNSSLLWAPIVPLFYRSTAPGQIHYNVLLLIDYARDEKNDTSRAMFLPLYYRSRQADENTSFVLGLYRHSHGGSSDFNFLLAFGYHEQADGGPWGWNALLTAVDYEVSKEIKEFRLVWGALSSYTGYRKTGDYAFDFLWFMATMKRQGDRFQSSLLPVWYYERRPSGYSMLSPALLSYFSETDGDRFQLALLGALWYRNERPRMNADREMLLMGIPFYYIQRPERGYEERGSLWGLLWQHESERETGFSKFSILKFVFNRVEMSGMVRYRIFGIAIGGG